MKIYKITGTFLMGNKYQKFTLEVMGKGKKEALEKLYSDLGSKHSVKRKNIKIEKIAEVKPENVEDSILRYKVGVKNA